ncbi:hypothetical protein ID741_003602 [Enterococcus sp. AZ103]
MSLPASNICYVVDTRYLGGHFLRIFIIEDQFIFRKKIIDLIHSASAHPFEIVEVLNERTFFQEIERMDIYSTDLFFIDIDLNFYLTGIDLAEVIRGRNRECGIVFCTSFEDKTIEIVNRQILPLGYLVKDKNRGLVQQDLARILQKFVTNTQKDAGSHLKLIINQGREKTIINEADIFYIATIPSHRNTLTLRYQQQEILVPGKLRTLKTELKSPFFIKELKSFILNINKIEKLYSTDGLVQFIDQTILDIGLVGTKKVQQFLREENSDVSG